MATCSGLRLYEVRCVPAPSCASTVVRLVEEIMYDRWSGTGLVVEVLVGERERRASDSGVGVLNG